MGIRIGRAWVLLIGLVVAAVLAGMPAPARAGQAARLQAESLPNVTITTPRAVSFPVGGCFTLTGRSSVPGAYVQLYSYVGTETPVATGSPIPCDSAGGFRAVVSPMRHTNYYAVLTGYGANSSTVDVAPRVKIGRIVLAKKAKKGRMWGFAPSTQFYVQTGGIKIVTTAQRYSRHKWIRVARLQRVWDSNATYYVSLANLRKDSVCGSPSDLTVFVHKFNRTGRWRFKVESPGNSVYAPTATSWAYVRVRK